MIDTDALIRAMGILASLGFGMGVAFAFLYGTVRPRLKRVIRLSKQYRAERDQARAMILEGAQKIKALQNTCLAMEKEIHRLDKIRERTDDYAREVRGKYENLQRRWSDRHQDRRAA